MKKPIHINESAIITSGSGAGQSSLERFPFLFAQARLDAVLLQDRQVFDKYLAHQMNELVLYANGQQAFGVELVGFTLFVQGPHPYARRALDLVVNARDRQTAFFVYLDL